jgi:outer membrane protein OmpA-like peptidoglycan-associated protein
LNNRRLILISLLILPLSLGAQEKFEIRYLPGEKFKIVEKYDLSKRTNTGYTGYIYREVRGVCEVTAGTGADNPLYEGKFYILEEMKKQAKPVAKKIDATVDVRFSIKPDGDYLIDNSYAYPTLRGFPAFPKKPVKPGDKWQAYGVRVIEPKRDGVYTRVKFYCDYQYKGKGDLNGVPCDIIQAQYAMRYKRGDDVDGDDRISSISGKHVVTIYFDAERTRPLFMRDSTEETYGYTDGTQETYKGFILTWFDMIVMLDRTEIVKDIRKQLEEDKIRDVTIEQRDEGIVLTVNKIHFLPDQAVVRPDELERLQHLADTLKKIKGRTILVRGHTAQWGSVETEVSLSVDRAKAIVDYLVSKGMPPEQFIFDGKGATQPVAGNDTEEGRVQNRRVEIIILED